MHNEMEVEEALTRSSNVEEELVDVIVMAEQLRLIRLIVKLDMGEVNRLAAAKMDRALEAK